MNIILVSQCNKRALKQTRRILDQFAERRGSRTWQTAITSQGLETLRRLLRSTARKNTAVACHWIRGKNNSELLWIVGRASSFNGQGAVPTNTTKGDVLRGKDENDWRFALAIRLLAAMAALFHDFGKAVVAFQAKLKKAKPIADPFRHEWVSLRIFEAFVGHAEDDRQWLEQLANPSPKPDMTWLENIHTNGTDKDDSDKPPSELKPLNNLPPLAKAIGWLIVSHHRLPVDFSAGRGAVSKNALDGLPGRIHANFCGSRACEKDLSGPEIKKLRKHIADCWRLKDGLPFGSEPWTRQTAKTARRILNSEELLQANWLESPYVMHMARLALMLADHHYSSLVDLKMRVQGSPDYPLYANTIRTSGELNQRLDEHLLGVEKHSGQVVSGLTRLEQSLPRIARHRGFTRRSSDPRFAWQDKAYDLACSLRQPATEQGFFGINMASTGCGKTLANGRIMYALADPILGARFSIALGLRTLTLQTGDAYRQRLELDSDTMAVQVGGAAIRQLHQLNAEEGDSTNNNGSESTEDLLPDNTYVHYEGSLAAGSLASWLENTRGVSALINAPILISTIDHLMPSTEGIRGGRQIAPMLRLMSSDLILDEPDDFDISDLYALSRLVNWAGMLGSRVLLSSATLPPSIVQGLFEAYKSGRTIYQQGNSTAKTSAEICCGWFDEYGCQAATHDNAESFARQHREWAEARVKTLAGNNAIRQRAYISDLPTSNDEDEIVENFAEHISRQAYSLHQTNHSVDPSSGKRASFGLIRMANIDPLIDVAVAMLNTGGEPNCRIHLCCYHARHPLLVRSAIETSLDQLLNRKEESAVFKDREIRAALDSDDSPDHMFIVLATPVAEVGRDHDYDWAIVEPSSMRSIIQLAGRVRRHRPEPWTNDNICLLNTNIKALKKRSGPVFEKPGFETKQFLLNSHDLKDLLEAEQYQGISSAPRILERQALDPRNNLADLEHDHLRAVMLGEDQKRKSPVDLWWTSRAHLSGELQRVFPFRNDPVGSETHALIPDEDKLEIQFKRFEQDGTLTGVDNEFEHTEIDASSGIDFWFETDYLNLLTGLAEKLEIEIGECARKFGVFDLPKNENGQGWSYHPVLGFRRRK